MSTPETDLPKTDLPRTDMARTDAPVPFNLADLVRSAADTAGDKIAIVFRGHELSWAQIDQRVNRLAAALRRADSGGQGSGGLGLVAGDRVAVQLGNVPEFVVAYFGALRAGLVVVPLNTGYTPAELRHILGDVGARAFITSAGGAETGALLCAELELLEHLIVVDVASAPAGAVTFDALLDSSEDNRSAGDPASASDPASTSQAPTGGEDLAVVLYTSGTSGRPKGALLSHRALLANLDQAGQIQPAVMTEQDVVLLVLPLFHIYGLNGALGMVAKHSATGVLVERFEPLETLKVIRDRQVTNVIGAPPMYVAWSMLPDIGDVFASVRLLVSGSAPLPAAVLGRVLEVTGQHVFEGYGLTETAPVLTSTLMSEVAKPNSIGRAIPGVEVVLRDERGRPVLDGDPGELVVRGANLFSGYWPDGAGGPDADGWFATGDVAVLDGDGDLQLVDRRLEMVLVSGFNVYPREVEEVLASHPDLQEAAVLGIAHPYTGESVKALVVLCEGARLSADDVIAFCARSLARFKCPTTVEFVSELPHSVTGKVSKAQLRESQQRENELRESQLDDAL